MSKFDWRLQGTEIACCSCDWGCPCQFNSFPTRGDCKAAAAMHIDKGHYEDIDLSGLRWATIFSWPKAIHEGNGECLPIVDERASEAQRRALLAIMSGETSEPGATVFSVFASTMTKMHEPVFAAIDFDIDHDTGIGHFSVPGILRAESTPITNPTTGERHRAKVVLEKGFEFLEADFVGSNVEARGPIRLDWQGRHGHIVRMDMTPSGPLS